jgi:hypothetical protein
MKILNKILFIIFFIIYKKLFFQMHFHNNILKPNKVVDKKICLFIYLKKIFFKNITLVGLYVHGVSYRTEFNDLYDYLFLKTKYVPLLFIGEKISDKIETKKLSMICMPCDYFVTKFNIIDVILTTAIISQNHLPKNSKKIYLSHDISDSSLGNPNDIIENFSHYDMICVSGEPSFNQYIELTSKFKKNSITMKTIIKKTGYPKVDRLLKKQMPNEKNLILICPTMNLKEWENYTLKKIDFIDILESLNNTHPFHQIIFRAHPHNLNCDIRDFIQNLKDREYKKLKILIDNSVDYFGIYSVAKFLITDFSGTASTFMAVFNRPAIFYLKNGFPENTGNYTKNKINELGLIAKNPEGLREAINKLKNDKHLKENLVKFSNDIIFDKGNSIKNICQSISEIL